MKNTSIKARKSKNSESVDESAADQKLYESYPAYEDWYKKNIRALVGSLADITFDSIQSKMLIALDQTRKVEERAEAAWAVISWSIIKQPFSNTAFYININPFVDIVKRHYKYGYLYSTIIDASPSEEALNRFKNVHPQTYLLYKNYCDYSKVAERHGRDLSVARVWENTK